MSTLAAALGYAARKWPVFPCAANKVPMTSHGLRDATTDAAQIERWWTEYPHALIGMPTGEATGYVVLDIDRKNGVDGFRTLGALGFEALPTTPTVSTRNGGAHLYFRQPDFVLRNTTGARGCGIGDGCDWRGAGGYVIVPSPGSGYRWEIDFDRCVPLAVPPQLLPRELPAAANLRPCDPVAGLDRYAERALDSACRRILGAPKGEQRSTLNNECFSIGRLAGAGSIPTAFARDVLLWAAQQIQSYDARRPWHAPQIARIVNTAFDDGLARPRGRIHG